MGHRIVPDAGRSLSKLTLWPPTGALVKRRTRGNARADGPGHAALDATGIEARVPGALAADLEPCRRRWRAEAERLELAA